MQKQQEETVLFEDGVRKIDYILTYTIYDKERDEKHADDREKRKRKREAFLAKFSEVGLEYETQHCSVSCGLFSSYLEPNILFVSFCSVLTNVCDLTLTSLYYVYLWSNECEVAHFVQESPDQETIFFVKVHGTFEGLLNRAELMGIKMPFDVSVYCRCHEHVMSQVSYNM